MPIIAEIEAEQKKAEQEPEFSWTEAQEKLFRELEMAGLMPDMTTDPDQGSYRNPEHSSEKDRQNGE
jgi:hypothetical protein